MAGTRSTLDSLDEIVELFAGRLAKRLADLLRPAGTDGVTTPESPFAAVTHNRITRRRIAKGQPGAWIVGRKHYLSPEALQEELAAVSRKRVHRKADHSSVADDLARAVALVAVGGGRR